MLFQELVENFQLPGSDGIRTGAHLRDRYLFAAARQIASARAPWAKVTIRALAPGGSSATSLARCSQLHLTPNTCWFIRTMFAPMSFPSDAAP